MATKTACYICEGCGIAKSLDLERLKEVAQGYGLPVTSGPALCLEDRARIAEDIGKYSLEAVVIAACSPREKRDVFRFDAPSGAPLRVQRVNLREQVAWSQPPGAAATQELAEDLLRMGIAGASHQGAPSPSPSDLGRTVLVVGGGPAGLSAAISAADAGHGVVLVEQEAELGGYLRRLHWQYPKRPPYTEPEPIPLDDWVAEAMEHPNVEVITGAAISSLSGQPGSFVAEVATKDGVRRVEAGAVILATGFRQAGEAELGAYGLGSIANVQTSAFLEAAAQAGTLERPSDGKAVESVAILLCDGKACGSHLPYADSVTSMAALKQALYVRDLLPGATVYLVFEDMQATGLGELFYRKAQEAGGIVFVRGQVLSVQERCEGRVAIRVGETNLARDVELNVDLAVLAAGMIPVAADESGGAPLHLKYLQGATLPLRPFGHADSNFVCFPYETRRTGIYAAGAAHRAQDIAQSRRDGAGAALKAIQAIGHAARGAAVHPRVGDLGYPQFFLQKCTSCARCTEECPFGALELDESRHPTVNPARCRRCGICMGACPVQIISFPDYSVEMVADMTRQVSMPEEDVERLRILVFACENDAYPALDALGATHGHYPASMRVVPVRCLGSVNAVMITDAISRGFDGVAMLGCRAGEDHQCHFIQGSALLQRRVENVRKTLERMALEPERVQVLETSIADSHVLPAALRSFAGAIAAAGPNPMKGF